VWGAVGFAALALFTQIVMHYRQRLALELGESVVCDLRNALFAHLQTLPMKWFHRTKVGRVISRMTSDIEDVRIGVQEVLFVSLVQLGQMLVAAAAMLWYDWQLFLIVLALAPVIWMINRHFHRKLSVSLRNMRESFSRVTATLAESVLGIRVTQGFVRHEENARIFAELATDHSRFNTVVMRTHGLFIPLLELNSQAFMAILLLLGGFRVLRPEPLMGVGDMVGFFFMAGLFFSPISILGNQYNQAMTAMAGAERLFALLDSKPEWSDPPHAVDPGPLEGRIEFQNVTFGYDRDRPVLHDISFTAEPGQTIDRARRPHGQREIVDHQSGLKVLSAGRRTDSRRWPRIARHPAGRSASANGDRPAKQLFVPWDGRGQHPRRQAGCSVRRSRAGGPATRLSRSARFAAARLRFARWGARPDAQRRPATTCLLRTRPAGRSADPDPG
jgi:ATP-binding cassette subfamily B protein